MTRMRTMLAASAAIAALLVQAPTWIIYNPSPSVPVGFYIRDDAGAFVTVRAVDVAPHYAAARAFDDARDRFIKHIAAATGETVCAGGDTVFVRGAALPRLAHDAAGRAPPSWEGCRTLAEDEVFLLGDTDDSFDSRYWGPVRRSLIEATWRPLFLNETTLGDTTMSFLDGTATPQSLSRSKLILSTSSADRTPGAASRP